jgi:hypothetical protein
MVDIPVWVGVAGVIIGSALLLLGSRKFKPIEPRGRTLH